MSKSIIEEKSFSYAVEIVKLCKELNEKKEYVLSRQLVRSGTSIGANVTEALRGQSTRDSVAKLFISRKEASECMYWLRILEATDYISVEKAKDLKVKCGELQKILTAIILTSKKNSKL